jgi:hypothetical protein
MRAPRKVYRPHVEPPKENLQDLLVRFATALTPQLYQSKPAPTRPIPRHRKLRPADIQRCITRYHHSQVGGVFVLELLSFLGTAPSGVMSNPT